MKTIRIPFLFFLILITGQVGLLAQPTPTIFDELYGEPVLEVTLVTDVNLFIANRNTEIYQPARIQFRGRSGELQQWDIKVRPRGRYRRRVCDFPPMKIKFPKKEIRAAGYARHNDLKLVTHCLDIPLGDELVQREHLVYQLYREVSDYAYRAQLVRITYIDNQGGPAITRYGIILEDEDELAERHQMEICDDCYGYREEQFEAQAKAVNRLFQQMIGNADWSLSMQRNIKILIREKDQAGELLFAPYDFDFADMVDAPYQVDDPLPFPDLTEEDKAAVRHMYAKRGRLKQLVENYPLLDDRARKQCLKKIEQFYRKLERKMSPEEASSSLHSGNGSPKVGKAAPF